MLLWSFAGWSAVGDLQPRPPTKPGLFIQLLGPISALRSISVAPATPPFRTPGGSTINVEGTTFLKVVLDGLTGDGPSVDTDVVAPAEPTSVGPGRQFVTPPVLELRRLANVAGRQTWIVGLDRPVCLGTALLNGFITKGQAPGDNVIFLELDRVGG
jgi:hypothetical protein